ncbi:MAG: MFS transporter [Bacteroidetes bacterium]|mgnify:CR=1 FL=1|nr:MAG: MFS transporter [Bacteroidota bacterium]REK08068.1 MAG: MFS transporter [Bacteroidota bacterium]REK32273.1 MAG: MFS transporter [Bacteroidota bacterium]REK47425.1 MAG: MFS transporter [Bacteroidota bacterium]
MDLGLMLLIGGWVFVLIWVPIVILSQRKMHPKALFTLFFAEMWERFSFYGMRAFLILYITSQLFSSLSQGEADSKAYGIYGAFNALLYAAPIVGGILADKLLGFRRAILFGGLLMAAGQFTLAATASTGHGQTLFFAGLGLLAVGNGLFKPNISSFLGTFYDRNDPRKDSAFTIFYMGINIGALLAPLTCGYLAREVDWSLGFLVAGIGMMLGLVVFWRNMSKYEDKGNPPEPELLKKRSFFGIPNEVLILLGTLVTIPIFSGLINAEVFTSYLLIIVGIVCIGYLLVTSFRSEDRAEGQRLLVFIALFFIHMLFWTLFEQAGGSLNILTDRYVDKMGIETSQFQAVNPLFIILLAPVFTWIWTGLSRKKIEPRTPIKFFYALLQMALGYFIIVWGTKNAAISGDMIPLYVLILMYLFHTTGELSLSPVGLSVVTKLSPAKTVGFVMGSWFLSIAFAHKIAGYLGQRIATPGTGEEVDRATALNAFADVYMEWGVYVVLIAAIVLLLISPLLKKWMHGIH